MAAPTEGRSSPIACPRSVKSDRATGSETFAIWSKAFAGACSVQTRKAALHAVVSQKIPSRYQTICINIIMINDKRIIAMTCIYEYFGFVLNISFYMDIP
jgi:hypothetical protein